MLYSGSSSVVSRVFDAALSPESWPLALEAVAETVGAIGAAYLVRSKETAGVEWISLYGPSAALAGRADEDTKLAQLIAAAAAREMRSSGAGRTLAGRGAGGMGYTLTVVPLRGDLTIDGRPLAIVIVTDPDAQSVSASDLADCFGLSPAESRLARSLMTGKKLADIAVVFGVQITTLRTQLSSILRKAGVKRQIDLLRVLPTVRNRQET